jgi:hypothetical protein
MMRKAFSIWNILGILCILAAIHLLLGIPERLPALPPEQHSQFIGGMVAVSGVLGMIASACLLPKSRPVTLRMIGAIGLASCIFNLVEGFQQRNFSQFPITLLFWLPGSIYLIIKGKMTDEPVN